MSVLDEAADFLELALKQRLWKFTKDGEIEVLRESLNKSCRLWSDRQRDKGRRAMSQMSFGDAEYAGKRKQTRREVFLAEMEQVVPWKSLLKLIEPFYPIAGAVGIPIRWRRCCGFI